MTIVNKVKKTIEEEKRYDIALSVIRKLESALRGIRGTMESYKDNNAALIACNRANNALYNTNKFIDNRDD
jgi:hypothetical protein